MLLKELPFVFGFKELGINRFIGKVLSGIVDLLIGLPEPAFNILQFFSGRGCKLFYFGKPALHISNRVIAMLLYVGKRFCHSLQVGELHFPGVGFVLLGKWCLFPARESQSRSIKS